MGLPCSLCLFMFHINIFCDCGEDFIGIQWQTFFKTVFNYSFGCAIFYVSFHKCSSLLLPSGGRGGKHAHTVIPVIKWPIRVTWINVGSDLIVFYLQFYTVSIKLKGNFFLVAAYFKCTKPLCVIPLAALQHCNLQFPWGCCEILMKPLLLWLPLIH